MWLTLDTTDAELREVHLRVVAYFETLHALEKSSAEALWAIIQAKRAGQPEPPDLVAQRDEAALRIRDMRRDRVEMWPGRIQHESPMTAHAFLARLPLPPESWRGRHFRVGYPVNHPGLWNRSYWNTLGFRPVREAKPFAFQDYQTEKRFTTTTRLYDAASVVPVRRRPRPPEEDEAEA